MLLGRSRKLAFLAVPSFLALAAASAAAAPSAATSIAQDLGRTDPAETIEITVQLKLPDRGRLSRTVDALYDRTSPTFHHWLSDADLAKFAPPIAQIKAVCASLLQNRLRILSVSKNGFSIRASGSVANVSAAFGTEIHQFALNGKTYRATIRDPALQGAAGSYVSAISGLASGTVRPMIARSMDIRTGQPHADVKLGSVLAAGGISSLITDVILGPSTSVTYSRSDAPLPVATYTGITFNSTQTLVPDYTPAQLQAVYGLDKAYKQKLDGAGQTIVLLEAYGYPTMKADANAFSAMTGLPVFTSATLKVIYPEGRPSDPQAGVLTGWDREIALDVEWAHAMAPGAKILVVAANGQNSEDFQAAMQYIIDNSLSSAVSDSWEVDTDVLSGPSEQESFEYILVNAAAKGISFQFSTGDTGDSGVGSPAGAPGVPSVAPHATAVGGTAILNKVGRTGRQTTSWGDQLIYVAGGGPVDPPGSISQFGGGGGGGESLFWPKPAWQQSLPGTGRQTPDISALADPYTGVPIVVYDKYAKTQVVSVGIGGTSLASPIFTAIWAIATQKAGHRLGQAAPMIAGLTSGLLDVLPLTSASSISGTVTDENGTTAYSTRSLFKHVNPEHQQFLA